ncbi:hypothetical protein O1157_03860 [Streptomyces albogriseolus]
MSISTSLLRLGPTVAAAAALALLPAGPAAADGISVSTTGNTVSVTTGACSQINGHWGTASLLGSGQANFSQGRQVALSGTSAGQSAAWSNVGAGTYTVIVVCSNGSTAGTQSVVVSPRPARRPPPRPSPSRGVMGGVGGGSRDYGAITAVAGGALVGTGIVGTVLYLRRRAGRPRHL